MDILYKDEAYQIVGAAMEVHKVLGYGFLEAIYQEALEKEFNDRGMENSREHELQIHYKDAVLSKKYVADFVCYGKIIVELKTVDEVRQEHKAQILNYLKASQLRLGILLNFGKNGLSHERFVY